MKHAAGPIHYLLLMQENAYIIPDRGANNHDVSHSIYLIWEESKETGFCPIFSFTFVYYFLPCFSLYPVMSLLSHSFFMF
jgi:hypothetical protein